MSLVSESVDAAYAAACSDGTLCSARGFWRALAATLVDAAPAHLLTMLASDADPVAAVLADTHFMEAVREVLSRVQPLSRGKCARASSAARAAAAAALRDGRRDEALALASQAVLRAPPTGSDESVDGGVTLALALWTRAEVLSTGGHQGGEGGARAALADLRLALRERLPARMRPEYYTLMGKCYKDCGEPTRAKVSFELALRLANNDAARAQLSADIAALNFSTQPQLPALTVTTKIGIAVTGGVRPNMPALSKLVKIVEEEHKGRFAVAAGTVHTGDVLLVDAPYAACLLSDYYGTHCLHCFNRLDECTEEAPVWCPRCAGVAFCSLRCRETAIASYHTFECPFLDLFIGSGMSILSHMALRMVTQAGLETSLLIHSKYISNEIKTVEVSAVNDIEGVAKKSKMKNRKERLNRAQKGLKTLNERTCKENCQDGELLKAEHMTQEEALEGRAAQVYSLCTHTEQRKPEDKLKRVVMALFLTECLKQTGFFNNCDAEKLAKAEVATCELLVRNLHLLQFNAHEVYETVRGAHAFAGSRPRYVAVGVYPTAALLNHECYPAVARYFEGRNIVLRASRPLAPGEVVSENYGPHFLVRTRIERQRALTARYWFRCECIACQEDWPTLKQMKIDALPYLRCPNVSCAGKLLANAQCAQERCARCNTTIDPTLVKLQMENIDRCSALYKEGALLMEAERGEDALGALCAGVELFSSCARAPHRDTHMAQEALRSCFAARGNVRVARSGDDDAAGAGATRGTDQTAATLIDLQT